MAKKRFPPYFKRLNDDAYYNDYKVFVGSIYKEREKEILKYSKLLGDKKDYFVKTCRKELDIQVESLFASLDYLRKLDKLKTTDEMSLEKAYIEATKESSQSIPYITNFDKRHIYIKNKVFNAHCTTNYLLNSKLVKTKYDYESQFKQETINKIDYYTSLGLKSISNEPFLVEFCDYLKKHSRESFYKPNNKIKEMQQMFLEDFEANIKSYDILASFDKELKTKEFLDFCNSLKDKKFLLVLLMFFNQLEFSRIISEMLSVSLNKVFSSTTHFNKLYLISTYLEEVITIVVNGVKVGQHNRLYDSFFELPLTLSTQKKNKFKAICESKRWKDKFKEYDYDISYDRIMGYDTLIIPISLKHAKMELDDPAFSKISLKRMPTSLSQTLDCNSWHFLEHYKLWLLKVLCLDGKIECSIRDIVDIFSSNLKSDSVSDFFSFLKSYLKMNQIDFERLIVHTFIAYLKCNILFSFVIPMIITVCYLKQKIFLLIPANVYKEQYYIKFRRFNEATFKKELYRHLLLKEKVPEFIVYNPVFKEMSRLYESSIQLNKNIIADCFSKAIKHIGRFPRFTSELPAELNGNII
jgi:hypothetical protein